MKEFIDKLIGRLEEEKMRYFLTIANTGNEKLDCAYEYVGNAIDNTVSIVNELAEEYKDKIIIDGQYCWQKCSAVEHCKECNRLGNGTVDYFGNYDSLAEEYNNGWIPCSERLPEKDVYVLCQGNHSIFIACIDSLDNKWRDDHYHTRTTIKAWQPLPPVYKECTQSSTEWKQHLLNRFERD